MVGSVMSDAQELFGCVRCIGGCVTRGWSWGYIGRVLDECDRFAAPMCYPACMRALVFVQTEYVAER